MKSLIVTLLGLVFSIAALAQGQNSSASSNTGLGGSFELNFPYLIDVMGTYTFNSHFRVGLGAGITPQPFYSVIGQVAAQSGGNSAYKDVIEAAFQNNSSLRFSADYYFDKPNTGFKCSVAGSALTSSGDAQIDTVLTAATGRNFTNLKNLLVAAGRSTNVSMKSNLQVVELNAGYIWSLSGGWTFDLSGGLVKVMSAQVQLKTGLTAFEATQVGNSLMRSSESDLQTIITDNGLAPELSASINYSF